MSMSFVSLTKRFLPVYSWCDGHSTSISACGVWGEERKGEGPEFKALFGLKKWSLITQFSSPITHHSVFITHHSSLITHHLKHPTLFGTITHLSSLNIFQLFVGPIHVPCAAFTLFIYFFP